MILALDFVSIVKSLLMVFFVLSGLLLVLVVLLQEPKGGGLSSAFGGAGAETFGVQARGVNKFTSYVAAIFMIVAVLYAAVRPREPEPISDKVRTPVIEQPEDGAGEQPGEEPGGAQPPGDE